MSKQSALITFIKNPEKGKVKTRLAATAGDDKALAIYKSLLEHTRKVVSEIDCDRLLFYSEQINESDDWTSDLFQKHLQHTGDLGERMQEAFKLGFMLADKVMIVGSDCPRLSADILREGFEALNQNDFVLGPAMDGGYYLLGMRKLETSLFHGIEWSTDQVANQTCEKIQQLGGSLYELPELSDIDYEADWKRYGWPI